jgi:ATP synthase I chain
MDEAAAGREDFSSRALNRIRKFMLVLGVAGLLAAVAFFGWRIGIGFALGASIAYLNFHWLKNIVASVADLTITSGTAASSRGVVHRFVLRYLLMAFVAFVILTISRESLYGLFAGLFLPVAALLCEAGYEVIRVVGGQRARNSSDP